MIYTTHEDDHRMSIHFWSHLTPRKRSKIGTDLLHTWGQEKFPITTSMGREKLRHFFATGDPALRLLHTVNRVVLYAIR